MDINQLTDTMEEAIRVVCQARSHRMRIEEELHQAEASLSLHERNADRIISQWLSARSDSDA